MIEYISNGIQMALAGICALISLIRAARTGNKAWILLGLFSGVFFLGDLYWLLYYLFYGETPYYSFISDLSWDAAYLFLFLLLMHLMSKGKKHRFNPVLLCLVIIPGGMCAFFMQYGEYTNNTAIAVLMSLLIIASVDGLITAKRAEGENGKKTVPIYVLTLVFCFLEYALWTSSCFFPDETAANPYYWLDILLSCCFVLYLPATGKAVKE